MQRPTLVLFGAKGWIGSYLLPLLEASFDVHVPPATVRMDDVNAVAHYLDSFQGRLDHVVSLIGRTHGPGHSTIDYLELPGKLQENVRDNLFAPVAVALLCRERGIHFTYMGTGCIFNNDAPDQHPRYDEDALPDFFGSGYSTVKGFTDRLMHMLEDSALNVRIRMPIVSDVSPRNFITKITSYAKVCSIPNSMTVLETLLPILVDLIKKGHTGTINLTNPGSISHNDILGLYRDIVDPSFTWTNFDLEEQNAILLSKRSNNVLDTTKLETMYPDVPDIRTAVQATLVRMAGSK